MLAIELVGDEIVVPEPAYRDRERIKLVPGTRWEAKDRTWRAPLAWTTCHAFRGVFGQELQIGPALTAWAETELHTWISEAYSLQHVEDVAGPHELKPFQRVAVRFALVSQQALLVHEMRVGKTAMGVTALAEAAEGAFDALPALVVCPNSVKRVWEQQFARWAPQLRVEVITGSAVKRRKTLEKLAEGDLDVVIINWEAVRGHSRLAPYGSTRLQKCEACGGTAKEARCEVHLRELNKIDFGTVIADEAHRGKNPQAKQTRALWAAAGAARYRWALTGTPIANAPDELWSLLHFINPKEWPSKTRFVDRYCAMSWNPFGGLVVVGLRPDTEAELRKSLDARMLRRTRTECLPNYHEPLPAEVRYVALRPAERKVYNQMRDQLVAELEGGNIVGWNPLSATTRLVQFASASGKVEPDGSLLLAEPSSKLDALMDTLDDLGDDAVVIAASSRQLIQLAEARLDKADISYVSIRGGVSEEDRATNIKKFQAGEVRCALLTVGAGGEGIELSRANTIIFIQRDWSLVKNEQALARVINPFDDDLPIQPIYLVTEDTIEERVILRVEEKGERLEEVVRDKERLKGLL